MKVMSWWSLRGKEWRCEQTTRVCVFDLRDLFVLQVNPSLCGRKRKSHGAGFAPPERKWAEGFSASLMSTKLDIHIIHKATLIKASLIHTVLLPPMQQTRLRVYRRGRTGVNSGRTSRWSWNVTETHPPERFNVTARSDVQRMLLFWNFFLLLLHM